MKARDALRVFSRTWIRKIAYPFIGAIGLLSRLRPVDKPASTADRLLVIRLDLLGDVLFSMPLVEGLRNRYPDADIEMLTLPYTAPLARLFPSLDRVVPIDTNRIRTLRGLLDPETWREYLRTARYVRSRRFDLAVSVNGRMASLCAFLSGSKRTVGYDGDSYPFMLTNSLPGRRYEERMHEVEYVRRLARFAGAGSVPGRLHVPVPPEALAEAHQLLHQSGITESDRLVVIHAGSVNGAAKRWPADHWAAFAEALQRETKVRILLVGSEADRGIADVVLQNSRADILSLTGKTDIPRLVALLSGADLVASGDSGPLHLAVALGRPVLAAYGPTDPLIYGPYNPQAPAIVLRHPLPCSPCYTGAAVAECGLGDSSCMHRITVQEMVEAATKLLGGREDQLSVPEKDALQNTE